MGPGRGEGGFVPQHGSGGWLGHVPIRLPRHLPGHLLVEHPGFHRHPQQGGEGGIVQDDADLRERGWEWGCCIHGQGRTSLCSAPTAWQTIRYPVRVMPPAKTAAVMAMWKQRLSSMCQPFRGMRMVLEDRHSLYRQVFAAREAQHKACSGEMLWRWNIGIKQLRTQSWRYGMRLDPGLAGQQPCFHPEMDPIPQHQLLTNADSAGGIHNTLNVPPHPLHASRCRTRHRQPDQAPTAMKAGHIQP